MWIASNDIVFPLPRPRTDGLDPRSLLTRCRTGDRDARHALSAEHFGLLARFFQNKVGAELDTLDLVSSTIDQCIETAAPLTRPIQAWLMRVAIDELLAYHRALHGATRIDPSVTATADIDTAHVLPPMTSVSPESRLLLQALRRVSLEHQIVLELRLLEGLAEVEIADLLEQPLATVRRQLWLGKQRLWRAIADTASSKALARSLTAGLDWWIDEIQHEIMAGRPHAAQPSAGA